MEQRLAKAAELESNNSRLNVFKIEINESYNLFAQAHFWVGLGTPSQTHLKTKSICCP